MRSGIGPTVYIYGGEGEFIGLCEGACHRFHFELVDNPSEAIVAIAPRLTRKLSPQEWNAPRYGTLIFHPSALPHRRGPDAIRWAVESGDRVSAATWFWCDGGLDTGPICEQEVVVLKPGESAGRAYHTRFIPAGIIALERALRGIASCVPKRIAQDEALASYQGFYVERGADYPNGRPAAVFGPGQHPIELMGP